MEDRFDVVSVGVQHERGVIGRMVFSFARLAVVFTAGSNCGAMEDLHLISVTGLKRQVDT